jgi:iron complex outermembrane recepter protein
VRRISSSIVLMSAVTTLVSTAFAQSSPPAGGATADSGSAELSEIIVTAQRTEGSLSKTPVAITVLSADELSKEQIVSEQDLRADVPGLSVRATTSSNQLNYALRGQSKDAFSGTQPGVLPYINDVQISGTGATNFYDLASVQVLKGPQGTLFGRSATGGAVLFTTAKPSDQFGGYLSVLGGDYSAAKVEGAVNTPLGSDTGSALRLAGFFQKRDGFQHNIYDDSTVGGIKHYGGRASLRTQLGPIENNLVYDFYKSDSQNTVAVISGLLPYTGAPGQPPFIPISFLYGGTASPLARAVGIGTVAAFTGAPASAAGAYYDGYFANPKHPSGGITQVLADQRARGPFTVDSDSNNLYNAQNNLVTNTTTLNVGEDTQLKNIFGYAYLRQLLAQEADGTPYGISESAPNTGPNANQGLLDRIHQTSDELQLLGNAAPNNRLKYVVGFYYSDVRTADRQFSSFFDVLFGGSTQVNDYVITSTTYALYGQGTYALNDSGLSVTAGARYTDEEAGKITQPDDIFRVGLGNPAPPGYSYDQGATYRRPSWTLGLQQQFDNVLVYAVTRRAYKSGGFNTTVQPKLGSAAVAGDEYRDERVTDVELGTKFAGRIGAMPTRVDLAVYNNWLVNSQRTAYSLVAGNPASLTVNVPNGRVTGFELDGSVNPIDWLSVGAALNYMDATYTNGNVISNGAAQVFDTVPDTPRWSDSVFAEVTVPVWQSYRVTLHADAFNQTETFTTPRSANNDGTRMPGYTLANFRIGLEDSRWSLTGNVKNAFNRVYFVGGLPTGEIYQINTLIPGEPRTFTVEARVKF